MNVSQLATQQQMMYRFISQNGAYASQMQALSAIPNVPGLTGNTGKVDADSLLQKMGVSGAGGRTVREMAKYQLEVQRKSGTTQSNTGLTAGSLTQPLAARTQYTPISDEATKAMQDLALKDAVNSVGNASSADSRERVSLIREHLQNVDPSKRAATFNTMNKVWESELDRIGEYIKQNDPSWDGWGDSFDTNILKDYKPGLNIWV